MGYQTTDAEGQRALEEGWRALGLSISHRPALEEAFKEVFEAGFHTACSYTAKIAQRALDLIEEGADADSP